MNKFIVPIILTLVLIAAVGSAGAMSFTIGKGGPTPDEFSFGPQFSDLVSPSATPVDLFAPATPGTLDLFGREAGWGSGLISAGFLLDSEGGGIFSPQTSAEWGRGAKIRANLIDRLRNRISKQPVAPVPEPATILMVGLGLIGLAQVARKKIKS